MFNFRGRCLWMTSQVLESGETYTDSIANGNDNGQHSDHLLQSSSSTPTPPHLQKRKNPSSNRLGTPLSRGVEKPEGPSALQPTSESMDNMKRTMFKAKVLVVPETIYI